VRLPYTRSPAALLLCLAAALGGATGAEAEARWASDQLDIPVRTGESYRYKIVRNVKSGTPLEVLGVNKTSGYAQVRTPDGTVGYVLERELQDEPAARAQLADLQARLAQLQQEPNALAAQLAKLQAQDASLRERFSAMEREKEQREQELATIKRASANVMDIANDREHLRVQVAELTRARADLEQQNRDLQNQTTQRWFLIGAGVLGGGVLIGLILPHVRLGRRRRSSWGTL
jgi:SH3 domain protein